MRLNELVPSPGAHKPKRRVGRGSGSGHGKTCGHGQKGQKSRSGGSIRPGFEGGQMPLQRRIPKSGFSSAIGRVTAKIRTSELNLLPEDIEIVDLKALKKAGLVRHNMKRARVFLSGEVNRSFTLDGIVATKGAVVAIEQAGGTVREIVKKTPGKLKPKKDRVASQSEIKVADKEVSDKNEIGNRVD